MTLSESTKSLITKKITSKKEAAQKDRNTGLKLNQVIMLEDLIEKAWVKAFNNQEKDRAHKLLIHSEFLRCARKQGIEQARKYFSNSESTLEQKIN